MASRGFLNGKLWSLTLFVFIPSSPVKLDQRGLEGFLCGKLRSLTLAVFISSSSGDAESLGDAAHAGEGAEKAVSHLVHAWCWTCRSPAWPRRRSTTGSSYSSSPSASRTYQAKRQPASDCR